MKANGTFWSVRQGEHFDNLLILAMGADGVLYGGEYASSNVSDFLCSLEVDGLTPFACWEGEKLTDEEKTALVAKYPVEIVGSETGISSATPTFGARCLLDVYRLIRGEYEAAVDAAWQRGENVDDVYDLICDNMHLLNLNTKKAGALMEIAAKKIFAETSPRTITGVIDDLELIADMWSSYEPDGGIGLIADDVGDHEISAWYILSADLMPPELFESIGRLALYAIASSRPGESWQAEPVEFCGNGNMQIEINSVKNK